MFYKRDVFKNFANFTGKHLCWWMPNNAHFEGATGISVKVFRPTALLKEDSNTGAFL